MKIHKPGTRRRRRRPRRAWYNPGPRLWFISLSETTGRPPATIRGDDLKTTRGHGDNRQPEKRPEPGRRPRRPDEKKKPGRRHATTTATPGRDPWQPRKQKQKYIIFGKSPDPFPKIQKLKIKEDPGRPTATTDPGRQPGPDTTTATDAQPRPPSLCLRSCSGSVKT